MNVIFDYNRTLYDPETESLVNGAVELLTMLSSAGVVLHLVSKPEPGRQNKIAQLGLTAFFASISYEGEKQNALERIGKSVDDRSYVIGDYLHNEIRIGNRLGFRTIWLKHGKFATLQPETADDIPWRTVRHLSEVAPLILD